MCVCPCILKYVCIHQPLYQNICTNIYAQECEDHCIAYCIVNCVCSSFFSFLYSSNLLKKTGYEESTHVSASHLSCNLHLDKRGKYRDKKILHIQERKKKISFIVSAILFFSCSNTIMKSRNSIKYCNLRKKRNSSNQKSYS